MGTCVMYIKAPRVSQHDRYMYERYIKYKLTIIILDSYHSNIISLPSFGDIGYIDLLLIPSFEMTTCRIRSRLVAWNINVS